MFTYPVPPIRANVPDTMGIVFGLVHITFDFLAENGENDFEKISLSYKISYHVLWKLSRVFINSLNNLVYSLVFRGSFKISI